MEISLYGTDGRPTMYIADDGETIYKWDGHAVCYLVDEKIYGWKGRHIGWFVSGVVYDLDGYRIGYTREKNPRTSYTGQIKNIKHIKYVKYVKHVSRVRPMLKMSESHIDLGEYLSQDEV